MKWQLIWVKRTHKSGREGFKLAVYPRWLSDSRGHDRMVVGFTTTYMQSLPITTKIVSSSLAHGKVYSIQHYVITFVSDLRQVGGFLRVFRFPPPIKLTATIYYWYIVESSIRNHTPRGLLRQIWLYYWLVSVNSGTVSLF